MAMSGKYADETPVTVSDDIEAAVLERLPSPTTYNAAEAVVFHCCTDGLVLDVPVSGHTSSRYPLNFTTRALERAGVPAFLADLKTICDGASEESVTRRAKMEEIADLP